VETHAGSGSEVSCNLLPGYLLPLREADGCLDSNFIPAAEIFFDFDYFLGRCRVKCSNYKLTTPDIFPCGVEIC